MRTQPKDEEIDRLLAFLPIFSDSSFQPVIKWHSNADSESGVAMTPYPEYDSHVRQFCRVVAKGGWAAGNYLQKAPELFDAPERIGCSDLEEICCALTFIVRGERFCDGHIAAMIKKGHVVRVLERLRELTRR